MSCLLCTQSCSDVYVCLVYNVRVLNVKYYRLANPLLLILPVVYLELPLRQFLPFGFQGLKSPLMGVSLVGRKIILKRRGLYGTAYKIQALDVIPGHLLNHTKYFYSLHYCLVLKSGVFQNYLVLFKDANHRILTKPCNQLSIFLKLFFGFTLVHSMHLFISC